MEGVRFAAVVGPLCAETCSSVGPEITALLGRPTPSLVGDGFGTCTTPPGLPGRHYPWQRLSARASQMERASWGVEGQPETMAREDRTRRRLPEGAVFLPLGPRVRILVTRTPAMPDAPETYRYWRFVELPDQELISTDLEILRRIDPHGGEPAEPDGVALEAAWRRRQRTSSPPTTNAPTSARRRSRSARNSVGRSTSTRPRGGAPPRR
jgi:hypothetical protein